MSCRGRLKDYLTLLDMRTYGTFMSSNGLVSHQTHKNGEIYDVKWSKKRLKNCSKILIFQNFQITSILFPDIVGVITTSKLSILMIF